MPDRNAETQKKNAEPLDTKLSHRIDCRGRERSASPGTAGVVLRIATPLQSRTQKSEIENKKEREGIVVAMTPPVEKEDHNLEACLYRP
jgi:hypothetical protein